jgi:beta-mannosidase
VIQAEGIAQGAIAGRINQDHCSGTLVWQLNDCWPVASWSSIDGHGRWKLLHHKLKEAFQTVLLHGVYEEDELKVGITANPGAFSSTIPGSLIVYVKTLDDQILNSEVVNLSVTSGKTTWLEFEDLVPVGCNKKNIVIHLLWSEDDAGDVHTASSRVYLVEPGELALKKGSIFIERFGWSDNRYLFEISASTYVKDVELYSPQEGNFSTNGFDLFPGASIRVSFDTFEMSVDPQIFARSLNDFMVE